MTIKCNLNHTFVLIIFNKKEDQHDVNCEEKKKKVDAEDAVAIKVEFSV